MERRIKIPERTGYLKRLVFERSDFAEMNPYSVTVTLLEKSGDFGWKTNQHTFEGHDPVEMLLRVIDLFVKEKEHEKTQKSS